MAKKATVEYLAMPHPVSIPCNFSAGPYMGRLLKEMKDHKKLWGNKCPSCGRIMFPPRAVCGQCHGVEAGDWVELSDKGRLFAYDVCYYPYIDPTTGQPKPVPWARGVIQLDGGGELLHFIEPADPEKLRRGMRVQAVWKEEGRTGEMMDILYFQAIEEGKR